VKQASDATIRQMTRRDAPGYAGIINWSVRDLAANFQTSEITPADAEAIWSERRERYPYFIAKLSGEVAGASWAAPWKPKEAYAWTVEVSVYVLPAFQRRGLARRLYERLFTTLEAQGYRTLLAGIVLPNEPSVRLHEGFGMKPAGVLEGVGHKMGEWRDVGYWMKRLGGEGPPGEILGVREALGKAQPQGGGAVR
jgi:phosphinothricin acetyltransferase